MIDRGPGFLAVVRFGSSPSPLGKIDWLHTGKKTEEGRQLYDRRGGGGGVNSYDDEKAWSSMSHSILSALNRTSSRRAFILNHETLV
jgi:hypothetical protein